MSLDLINHKLTTSTTDENGVITWSNPAVDVKINSKGQVFKYGEIYKGNTNSSRNGVCYYSINYQCNPKKQATIPFSSLYSRMVLGVKLGTKTIKLKDKSKGYLISNTDVVKVICNRKTGKTVDYINNSVLPKELKTKESTTLVNTQQSLIETRDIDTTGNKQFYTLYEAKNEHTTEDGAVFPTKELAEWHQTKVTKGKGNAQVVLDYNGGYVLAEQIYLQEVVYNKAKPYTNFIDVLNNNQGIVSVVQEEHCKFDKLDNEHGFRSEICFMTLRKQLPEQVSKHQAQKIQGALERYSDSVKALDESIVGLEALLKQVK